MQLKEMIDKVNTFRSVESYLNWLNKLSDKDLAIWAAWPTSQYFVRGAIEDAQRKRDIPKLLTKDHPNNEGGWIFARNSQSSYPTGTKNSGKWMIFPHLTEVDIVWTIIEKAIEQGQLGDTAKVALGSGAFISGDREKDDRVICIYTYDSEDRRDLLRILRQIRNLGINHRAFYKENNETHEGNYDGINIVTGQPTTKSPTKYYARPGEVELLVPKSRN